MSEPDRSSFLATRWSMLDQRAKPDAEESWRWFIERYRGFARGVLSTILRARGRSGDLDAALDEFWAYVYSSEVFERADRERRFRSFLAGTLRNFARDYCRKNPRAHGMGGDDEEESFELEPETHDPLPEHEELRLFAQQVLQNALRQLGETYPANAIAIRVFYGLGQEGDPLAQAAEPKSVADIAALLQIKPNAVHQVLHKARKRLRTRIESEIAETATDEGDLQLEIRAILEALANESPGLTADG